MHKHVTNGMKKVHELLMEATKLEIKTYFEHIIFTWRWWILLIGPILLWILWFKYRKKESTDRLLYAGFIVVIITLLFDSSGHQLGAWQYFYGIIPFIPMYMPWDLGFLPVYTMFFIQIKPHVKPYKKAIIYSGLLSFVLEPIFMKLEFFHYPKWDYIYSFFVYIGLYLIANYVSERMHFERIK